MFKAKKARILILGLSLIFLLSGCGIFGPEETMEIDPPQITLEDPTNLVNEISADDQAAIEIAMEENAETIMQTIYFFDATGDIVPLTLDIPKVEGIGKEVLKYMTVGGPAEEIIPEGFRPVIPAGTTVDMNIKAEEKLAIVDFSKEFLNYEAISAEEEKKILDAITWSITEFPSIDKVEIRVNGWVLEEMPLFHTPVIGPLSRADGINIELANNITIGNTSAVTLYFSRTDNDFSYLVPVTRLVPKTDDIARTTIEQLIIGPKPGSNLTSALLPTTKILDVQVSNDILVADFDDEVLGFDMQMTDELINMLVWSLTENTDIPTIQIKIKGETNSLPENLAKPITKPVMINATIL